MARPAPVSETRRPAAGGHRVKARAPSIVDFEYVDKMSAEAYAQRPPQREGDSGVDLASCLGAGTIVGPKGVVDIPLVVKCELHEKDSGVALPRSDAPRGSVRVSRNTITALL